MFYIPYGHIKIRSRLKSDEIERRLKEQLESQSIISGMFRGNHKYFQGSFENGQFKISRIINYKNSFRPVIIGNIQSEIDHTIIDLTVRLDYVVMAIMFFILFGFPASFVLQFSSFLFQSVLFGEQIEFLQYLPEGYLLKFVLSSIGTFLFFYLFVIIPFNIEADKATKYLNELFENQVISQENSTNFIG